MPASRSPNRESPTPLPSLPESPESASPGHEVVPFSSLPEIDTRADRVNLEARISYPGLELHAADLYTAWKAQDRASWWRRFWVFLVLAGGLAATAVVCGIIAGVLLKQPGPPPPSSATTGTSQSDNGGGSDGPNSFSVDVVVTSISGHLTTITRTDSLDTSPTDVPGSSRPDELSPSSESPPRSALSTGTETSHTTTTASSFFSSSITSTLILPSRSDTTSQLSSQFISSGPGPGSSDMPTITSGSTLDTELGTISPTPDPPAQPEASTTTPVMEQQSNNPTHAVDPKATPRFPVWFGGAESTTRSMSIGFVDTGADDSGCHFAVLLEGEGNPCGRPVLLADGLVYTWNGCGGATWVDWRNPASGESKFKKLSSCAWDPQTWQCGDTTVKLGWKCPP